MRKLAALCLALALCTSCGDGDASRAVKDFTEALADSSYEEAWNLLTPGTRARYDSTVVILHHFGYTEALPSLTALAGEMTEEEFTALSGQELFTRMVSTSGEAHRLSSSIRSVSYPDSTLAVVVVRTSGGSQEIPVRLVDDAWLVDLTGLAPPSEEGD